MWYTTTTTPTTTIYCTIPVLYPQPLTNKLRHYFRRTPLKSQLNLKNSWNNRKTRGVRGSETYVRDEIHQLPCRDDVHKKWATPRAAAGRALLITPNMSLICVKTVLGLWVAARVRGRSGWEQIGGSKWCGAHKRAACRRAQLLALSWFMPRCEGGRSRGCRQWLQLYN